MNFMKVSEEEPTQTHLNTAQSDSNMIVESFQKSNEAFRMMNCQEQPLEVINNKQREQIGYNSKEVTLWFKTFKSAIDIQRIGPEVRQVSFRNCKAADRVWRTIIKQLASKEQLNKILFSECKIGKSDDRQSIAEISLTNLTNIKQLVLEQCSLNKMTLHKLARLRNLESLQLSIKYEYRHQKLINPLGQLVNLRRLCIRYFGYEFPRYENFEFLLKLTKLEILQLLYVRANIKVIAKLTNLVELSLSIGVSSTHEQIRLISTLRNLKKLHLNGAYFVQQAWFSEICKLQKLTDLKLTCQKDNIKLQEFQKIKKLKKLQKLDIPNLKPQYVKVIPLLPEITELNLYRSSFRDVGCHDLFNNRKGLKNLKVLQVEFCGIGDIGASLISTLPDLEILSFGGNKISEIGLRHLSALPNLTYLDMTMNEVSNKGAKIISKMSKLSSLLLDYNQIGDQGLDSLCRLANLTNLSVGYLVKEINQNKLGIEGVYALRKMIKLRSLCIGQSFLKKVPKLEPHTGYQRKRFAQLHKLGQYLFRWEYHPVEILKRIRSCVPGITIQVPQAY